MSNGAIETLGTIIEGEEGRDAIHVAVEPVIAAERLMPGDSVGFETGGVGTGAAKLVGIVDPFLKRRVEKGQRFWMLLFPRTITGLRHVWTHPDFPEDSGARTPKHLASEKWLRDYAASVHCEYEELMENAKDHSLDGNYFWCEGGRFEGIYLADDFWEHYETVTDSMVPESNKTNFFICSC